MKEKEEREKKRKIRHKMESERECVDFFMRTRVRERFSIKLRKIRTPTASRRLGRIPETLVDDTAADDEDDPRNSFGSAGSVKDYDYCRMIRTYVKEHREMSEAAGKSEGFVLRRLRFGNAEPRRKSPKLYTGRPKISNVLLTTYCLESVYIS